MVYKLICGQLVLFTIKCFMENIHLQDSVILKY